MGCAGGNNGASTRWFGGWPVIPGEDRWDERLLSAFGEVGWMAAVQSSRQGGVEQVRAGPFGPGTVTVSQLRRGVGRSSPRKAPGGGIRRPIDGDGVDLESLSEIRAADACCATLPALDTWSDYVKDQPSALCGSTDEILVGYTDWHAEGGRCVASVQCRDQSNNAFNCECLIGRDEEDSTDRQTACTGHGLPVEGAADPIACTYDPGSNVCWCLYTCEDGGVWYRRGGGQCEFSGESYSQPQAFYDQTVDMPDCGGGGGDPPTSEYGANDDEAGDMAAGVAWGFVAVSPPATLLGTGRALGGATPAGRLVALATLAAAAGWEYYVSSTTEEDSDPGCTAKLFECLYSLENHLIYVEGYSQPDAQAGAQLICGECYEVCQTPPKGWPPDAECNVEFYWD